MTLLLNALYLFLLLLLSPWLIWRSFRTGRYRQHVRAKLFGTSPLAVAKPLVWFHAVSVGEIHLLTTIVQAFRQRFPGYTIAVSSTTDTGLAEAQARFPNEIILPFPLDFSWAVHRTLNAVQPKLIVLAESELWPNFLRIARQEKIPVVVINARMSPRSFRRMMALRGVVRRWILQNISAIAVQADEYAERFRELGATDFQLTVTGSIKYDGATGNREAPAAVALRVLLNRASADVVWVAGSTHAPEEEIVLRVYAELRQIEPHLKLILVPRHPDRFAVVAGILQESGLPFVRRSSLTQPCQSMPDVLLLDTLGELGAAWGLADFGFTGGSLDGHRGGQSMIEPAGYGVPVVFGPHVWNFRDAARRLVEAGAARQVRDEAELLQVCRGLITHPELRIRMGHVAQELVRQQQGATERTLNVLEPFLSNP